MRDKSKTSNMTIRILKLNSLTESSESPLYPYSQHVKHVKATPNVPFMTKNKIAQTKHSQNISNVPLVHALGGK